MAVEYPDVMGDYIDAQQRFDTEGLHYICFLEPESIVPGGQTELLFLVQSAMDVPLEATVHVSLPARTGPLGRSVDFRMAQPEINVNIAAGEVGLLHLPLACAPDTPNRTFEIKVDFTAKASHPGQRVRPLSSHGRLGKSLIRDPVGLKIAQVIGVGYVAKQQTRQTLRLEVVGEPEQVDGDLSPGFDTLWTTEELEYQHKAQREVSDRRTHILPKLTSDALYTALWQESRTLFEGAGLPLRMGEAIFVARILAYTATTFINKGDWYDAFLVPIWMEAIRDELPTGDALWIVTQVGYEHLLRLSTAVSFGLMDRAMGRDVWSNEEQRGVIGLLSNTVCRGQGTLPSEFLYLPLILGGLAVARELRMPEEDLHHSLQLLEQAHRDRASIFNGEVAVVNDLFEQLMLEARR